MKSDSELMVYDLIRGLRDGNLFGEDSVLKMIGAGIGASQAYEISGEYQHSLVELRSIIYWQAADRIHLPWYPDVLRVPFMVALNQNLRSSLTDQVYSLVAKAFNATVDELLIEDLPYEAAIPPLGALLLCKA
jgi:hypothetical protein